MRQRILSAWGYQTWPFPALCTFHFLKIFHIFHLHTGRANSYYPRGLIWRKGTFCQLQNWMRQWVLSAWGIHPGPFWASSAKIWAKIFDHLDLYTGAPFSYYPRGEKRDWQGAKVKRCQQHPVFPGGLPSKYWPGSTLLNFTQQKQCNWCIALQDQS